MKDLYLIYLKDNTAKKNTNRYDRVYMFDIIDLRSFVYKYNKKFGMPYVKDLSFVWKNNSKDAYTISVFYGEKQLNIQNLIGV